MSEPARQKFLLCPPRFYGVYYVINPWMRGNVGRARADAAARQWEDYFTALSGRAEAELLEPAPGLPDMPFTANAGLVSGDTFIPSRMRFAQRRPETPHALAWFQARGFKIAELGTLGSFEGEGDALFQPGEPLLWAGYGVRTSLESHRDLAGILGAEIVSLRLVDERFYHLDTCFCPLPGGRVFYFPGAFDAASLEQIRSRAGPGSRFEVSETDALNFACNAVCAGGAILANSASPELRARLSSWGYEPVITPLSEFVLAGGAAKCLVLRLTQQPPWRAGADAASPISGARAASPIASERIEVEGHLIDTGLMTSMLDSITELGGSFEVESFEAGLRRDQMTCARLCVSAPNRERLDAIVDQLLQLGARTAAGERDARLQPAARDGVAPERFYCTTAYPTDVRIQGNWICAQGQRANAVLIVPGAEGEHANPIRVRCALLHELRAGDLVVCGTDGIRIHAASPARTGYGVMGYSGGESEKRADLAISETAWEMRRIRARGGKIAVAAGSAVIQSGGASDLSWLIRNGFVHALLAGDAFAIRDVEHAMFGASLGVDPTHGIGLIGGPRSHLRTANLIRACGGIGQAVKEGLFSSGVLCECARSCVPFALAGSIRDCNPLPDTYLSLEKAQAAFGALLEDVELILILASALHGAAATGMVSSETRAVCVDIAHSACACTAGGGAQMMAGIASDVGLFLEQLRRLIESQSASRGNG